MDVAIEYGPLSLYRYNDTLGGFAYDFIRHIEASAGLPVKFHPVMTLSEALEGIDEGYYRMAVAAMPLSASLSRNYASTVPVFLDRQVYVQMLDDSGKVEVRTQLDLACRTVHVMSGSPVAERLRNLASETIIESMRCRRIVSFLPSSQLWNWVNDTAVEISARG